MSNVFVVLERYEEEVSATVFGDEERALRRIQDRRSEYVEDLDESPQFIADGPSRVYDNNVGWEIWYEEAAIR